MAVYEFDELSMLIPDHWIDRTINIFSDPANKERASSVTISRDVQLTDEQFPLYAERQLVSLSKTLDGFELEERKGLRLNGKPAVFMEYTWRTGPQHFRQAQLFLNTPNRVVLITFTALAQEFEMLRPEISKMLVSIRPK